MRILGIDPGIATTGYGIVEKNLKDLRLIKVGVIKTERNIPEEKRLLLIYNGLLSLIEEFKPDCCAVEDIFFFKNTKTAMRIGEVKGVCMLGASYSGIPVYTYTPLQIKQAIVGFGRATKYQISQMLKRFFFLNETIEPDDASDALACAICHINSCGL